MTARSGTALGTGFVGTGRLVRLALRRDRIVLPVWVAAVAGVAWAVVASYQGTVRTADDRLATALFSAGNPLTRVMDGPASGTHIGAMALVEGWKVLALLTALMAAQTVVRHTRQDEETGRAELLGSAVVGQYAALAAALAVAAGASLAVGVASAVAIALPSGLAWPGALAAGMAVAGMGVVFAAVAAVAAQVCSTARAAQAVAGGALGLAYLLRAVGDLAGDVTDGGVVVRSAWPSWLSPYGWGQQVRPYHEDNWWVGLLFLGLAAALLAAALVLADRRDVGQGMVRPRPGPARAPTSLRSAVGLAWRLQRGLLVTWWVGLAVAGAMFGWVGDDVAGYVAENEALRAALDALAPGGGVVELYQVLVTALLGLAAGGYAVQALLRMRAEEVSGRLEPVLATATSRRRWFAGHVLLTVAGAVVVLGSAGVAGAVAYGLVRGSADGTGDLVVAALVQVPAVLALGGFVVAVFGALPRWAGPVTWSALAAVLVVGQLGTLFDLPQWPLDVSPYTHVPRVPVEALAAGPLVWLAVVAVAAGGLGLLAFDRRDLAVGA